MEWEESPLNYTLRYHQSFSQEALLRTYGGVVPELAARYHVAKIFPLLREALDKNNIQLSDLTYVASTQGPGLLGPLLTGLNTAKVISLTQQIPLIGVNHLFAHLEAIHYTKQISYPYLGLVVSGGHTFFALVESGTKWKFIGSTLDDAIGEALDKGGKMLQLSYPAGKKMDEIFEFGNPHKYSFPIHLKLPKDQCHLSYSGIKNAIRLMIEKMNDLIVPPTQWETKEDSSQVYYDVLSSYMFSVFQILINRIPVAIKLAKDLTGLKDIPLIIGGGVACSKQLRNLLKDFSNIHFVTPECCSDNALMVALWAIRNLDQAIPYPKSLDMDAYSRTINRSDMVFANSQKNEQSSEEK